MSYSSFHPVFIIVIFLAISCISAQDNATKAAEDACIAQCRMKPPQDDPTTEPEPVSTTVSPSESTTMSPSESAPMTTSPSESPTTVPPNPETTLPQDPKVTEAPPSETTAAPEPASTPQAETEPTTPSSPPDAKATSPAPSSKPKATTVPSPKPPKKDEPKKDSPKKDTPKKDTPESKISPRKGKQLDAPDDAAVIENDIPSAPSSNALVKLIMDLTKKIEDLENTQRELNQQIGDLQRKLENSPQFQEKKEETTKDLISGDPDAAVEKWQDLADDVDTTENLQNVTGSICENALDQGAPPTKVLDFVEKIPEPDVQEHAYNACADKINSSEPVQEQLYWKEMTPYCSRAAENIGPNNPATINMYQAQNQVRLNAAKPIADSCRQIQQQQYIPAVSNWLSMVRDIPDSQPQLETNMKKMMLRTYEGNPANLPNAFQFILILPHNQGYYKQVAYKCLTQEMKANGHNYNPNNQQGGYN